jgi:hypothetical protein
VTYHLHPEAAAEHKKQVAYYEDKQAGLGRRYHAEFRVVLAAACEAPQRERIEAARQSLQAGRGVALEKIPRKTPPLR